MPIFIDSQGDTFSTCWRRVKIAGITAEATKRRIKCCTVGTREELLQLAKQQEEPSSLVLILASNEEFIEAKKRYADIPMPTIIFAHHLHNTVEDEFSYVMSDLAGSMRSAVQHLRAHGCKHLALFGVNFESNHDLCRVETFKHASEIADPLTFDLAKGLKACIRDLLATKEPIDGLLCINDFCALRLMHALDAAAPDWRERLLMVGFADPTLSALHPTSLTSVSLNYFESGREVVKIHRRLAKNPNIAHLHTVMSSHLQMRDSTAALHVSGIRFADLPPLSDSGLAEALYLSDPLMTLENILSEAEETPLRLMLGLLEGRSLENIAKELFFSRDGLLYHLRKLKRAFNIESTKELVDFLCRWVDADKLKAYIK